MSRPVWGARCPETESLRARTGWAAAPERGSRGRRPWGWGRSRSCWRRPAPDTSRPWRSCCPGSGSPQASGAAAAGAQGEAAAAAAAAAVSAPRAIPSPACSGGYRSGAGQLPGDPPSPACLLGPQRDRGSGGPGGVGLRGAPGLGQAAQGARGASAGPRGVRLSSSRLTRQRRMVGVPRWQPPPHGTAGLHPRPLLGASCCISQATLEQKICIF